MVSNDLIAIATLQPSLPSSASGDGFRFTLPRLPGRVGGGVRSGFDAGLMTAGLKKRHQASPRDGGGHGVDEGMIIQNLMGQHSGVEHKRNFAGNVVDGGEGSNRARFHPQQLPTGGCRSAQAPS